MSATTEPTTMLSARVPQSIKADLDKLVRATGRNRNTLVEEALHRFIEQQHWQIAEIEAGLQEANAGIFVSDVEMNEMWAEFSLEPETAGGNATE